MAPLELIVAARPLQELGPALHLALGTLSRYCPCNCGPHLGDARGCTGGNMAPLVLVVAAPPLQEIRPAHHLSHSTLSWNFPSNVVLTWVMPEAGQAAAWRHWNW